MQEMWGQMKIIDSSNSAGDVGSAENCSLSSPRQAHDNLFSSTCVSGDVVYTSASDRTTGSIFSGTGSSVEPGKGDMSRLVDAIANLDICEDKIDNGKYDLSGSKEEHEQHEHCSPWPHRHEDIKGQCSKKDLVSKPADSGPEEKEVYPEVKHDSACRSQLHTVPAGNSLCSPDLHISVGSNPVINCSVSQSSYVHARGISEQTLCKSCGIDAVGLLTCNCTQDATAAISGGSRNEAEAVHRIAAEEGKMNYVTLPNEILMGALVTSEPETIKMVVDCGKANTELCSIESVSVTQTYMPEISFIRENEVNATSSMDSCVSFSQTVSRPLSELSEDMSASASEPKLPSLSIGTHALAPNVQTFGVLEPFLNQNLTLSCPTTGVFSHNTSTPKIVPLSLSFLPSEPSWVHPQLTSSCTKIQNSGAVPKYVTCSTKMNNTFQDFAGNRKYSFGVPLRSKQTVAAGISNVFSWPLASETSFFQDMPPKCSGSSDSCIWKSTNKSSVTVLDSSSRESSVFTGFKFCTLGSPISSSSISKLSDGSFQHGRTTFCLDSEEIFNCGAPCTESVMAAAGTTGNTYFTRDFTAEVNMCSNTVSTSGQNIGCSITAESSGMSASAFVSFGQLSSPTLIKNSPSVPNTSAVSVGLFGKELRIASSSASATKVTTGYQFGKLTSLSLSGSGTEFERSTPYRSKLGFESYFQSPEFEPLKETSLTKTAFADVFPGDRTGHLKSPGKASGSSTPTSHSSLFPPGSTEMKQSDGMKAFDYVSNFKNVPSCSPNNFNTSLISNGFNFGIPSAAASHTLFSFTGSVEKLGHSSELNLQKRRPWRSQCKDSRSMKITKTVQTTDCLLEEENYLADIWKILECPVCLEIVTSPVLQCERGHHVCDNCWKRVTSCPLCKQRRSRTRNYAVEAMVEKIPLPCKYRVNGCSKTMCQKDKAAHENTCRFRTYICLVDNCNEAHTLNGMRFHLTASHSHVITENGSCICKGQKFSHTLSKSSFQSLVHAFDICDWGLFFLCHRTSGQNTWLGMQMVSLDPTNTDFLYSIEVANEEKLQSVTYKGPVVPLHTVINGQQEDCLVLTNQLLDALKTNNEFCIKVLIWKE